MSPLRILQINSMLKGGGTDDQCIALAGGLRQLGQTVFLAGPAGNPFAARIAQLEVPFFDTGRKANKFQYVLRAARFIRRQRIQIVHGHHGRDLWPAVLAARLAGTHPAIVLTRHLAKSPGAWVSRRFLLGQCDALIAVSQFVAKVLREGVYQPDSPEPERRRRPPMRGDHGKIQVIYGGIDTAKFKPAPAHEMRRQLGLSPGDFAFAVAGGFDFPRGKGQREFLAAAARIHQEVPQARFLIIGRGALAGILTADLARLGLGKKARLTGHVADMPLAMNAIDCLVHAQIGTEALGLVVCEAHACGKPVIASDLDGIPEAFAPGGYGRLVAPENIGELAQAMKRQALEGKLDLTEAASLHARVAEFFSISRMAAGVLDLYGKATVRAEITSDNEARFKHNRGGA